MNYKTFIGSCYASRVIIYGFDVDDNLYVSDYMSTHLIL